MHAPRTVTTLMVSMAAAGALLLAGCGSGTTASGVTCVEGGDCAVGDTGPGGGFVFYKAEGEQPWGRYLEAAPDGWNQGGQDPLAEWCDKQRDSVDDAYDTYWSSTQTDAEWAWSLNFQNGSLHQTSVKDSWLFVRPVRAF